jgi:hypothetical protein
MVKDSAMRFKSGAHNVKIFRRQLSGFHALLQARRAGHHRTVVIDKSIIARDTTLMDIHK